jgi:tRNA(Ile)-lysidine synthase
MPLMQLLRTIDSCGLSDRSTPLVVGVSGGADSLALLHMLRALEFTALHAAALDHGLRGDAGAADAAYVRDLCAAWGIPVTVGQAHLDASAPGVEARARDVRYAFLARVALEQGAAHVAVAHHADDQAETVLLHLLRGAGLRGLRGMALTVPLPGAPGLTLVRPLLDVARTDLLGYCAAHGITPRHDATNDDVSYLRNRLRHDLLPRMAAINPQVSRGLVRLARHASRDDDYLEAERDRLTADAITRTPSAVSLPRDRFAGLHPALQHRHLYWAAAALKPGTEPGADLIAQAVTLALAGRVGTRADLSAGVRLRVDYGAIVVEVADADPLADADRPLIATDAEIPVAVPGITPVSPRWSLVIERTADGRGGPRLMIPDGARVSLRPRRTGDRFAPRGLNGHHQTMKKWMIDHQVPQRLRLHVPLLIVDERIAAVLYGPPYAVSHEFSIEAEPQYNVRFDFELQV